MDCADYAVHSWEITPAYGSAITKYQVDKLSSKVNWVDISMIIGSLLEVVVLDVI